VLIVGVGVGPMVVRHRRVVRRSRQAPSAGRRVTAGPVPVRAVLLDDPEYWGGAVWTAEQPAGEQARLACVRRRAVEQRGERPAIEPTRVITREGRS
jgi:hypothetical protein